jgi:hypothetical protein
VTALGVLVGRVTHHLDRIDRWQGFAPQEGDQLGDRGNAEDIDASDKFRLPGLTKQNDHPLEACLLSRERSRQNPAYRPKATVQPRLAQ